MRRSLLAFRSSRSIRIPVSLILFVALALALFPEAASAFDALCGCDGAILAERRIVPPGGAELLDLDAALGVPFFEYGTLDVPDATASSPRPVVLLVDCESGDVVPFSAN